MDYRILGPLEVVDGDRPVALGADRQRAVLGQLLLHRNEVVASERLIDELWGERPPATAGKILQNYVSQLRRALGGNAGDGPLETHGRGYRLEVEPGALDLDRFEHCLESGRKALAAGDAEQAAAAYREGLRMWRGPPLPELVTAPEATVEIERIRARRLVALEGRVEADLARGRHAELIGELEAAVAREPLHERLRGQLMLALYRSGRQAEALEVYRDGRRVLAEEVGLDPGPALNRLERAILDHDPALRAPVAPLTPPRRASPHHAARRRRLLAPMAALLLLLAAAAAAILELRSGGEVEAGLASAAPNSVVAIDPATGRIVSETPVGENPGSIAAGAGAVWVLNGDDRTVSRIDAATRRVTRTFGIDAVPTAVSAVGGAVWIGAGSTPPDLRTAIGPGNLSARSVRRIDGASGATDARIALPGEEAKAFAEAAQRQLAAGEGAVWAVMPGGGVARIDPATNRARVLSRRVDAGSLAVGGGSVWALGPWPYRAATIWQLDPRSGHVVRTIHVPADGLNAVVFGAGALWGTDSSGGNVWRIEPGQPGRRPTMQTVASAPGLAGIAFEPHGVWVTNRLDDTVSRIDPATNRVSRVIHLQAPPRDIAVGAGRVWVTLASSDGPAGGGTSTRPAAPAGVRGAQCRPVVFAGSRQPDVLVVSDLPLQGTPRADTQPMASAVAMTLKRHGFHAGRFSVGYQSCDDATTEANSADGPRCRHNARVYAAERRVVGVIGPSDSFCASLQVAVANRARGGPLAMLSPSTTAPGLTRAATRTERGEPADYFPTGQRSFARVIPADDAHGAAAAVLARNLHLRRIAVVDDAQPFGGAVADVFERAARQLHVRIVGRVTWDGHRPTARLRRRVKRARPDGVFISIQAFDANGGRLVRGLRQTIGRRGVLIGTDGLKPVPLLHNTVGRWADGLYLTSYLIPSAALSRRGREFLRAFARSQPGGSSPYWALYAAQATEVLLAAIARSDGTRASITRAVFAAGTTEGPLGRTAIDRNGDVTPTRIPVYRVAATRSRSDPLLPLDLAGAELDRVITPPARLLRYALGNDRVG